MRYREWQPYMLAFRAASATTPQLAYLYIYAHIPLDIIGQHTGIARKTLERILTGQPPKHRQLKQLSQLCRKVAQEFKIAQQYSRADITGSHHSHLLYNLYTYGEYLAAYGLVRAQAMRKKS